MATLAVGSIIVTAFPFSDLSAAKRRPAVVLAEAGKGDWILCMVTSNAFADPRAIRLDGDAFESGSLDLVSFVRPAKLFTASDTLMSQEIAKLKNEMIEIIRQAVVKLFHP